MMRVWLAACAAALALTPGARADDAPAAPPQGAYVVVVGVGAFADPAITARPTAEADARAVYDVFADPAYGLAPAGRVVLLTGTPDDKRKSTTATRENVVKALHDAATKTGKDDAIVVMMFGRGASSGDQTCFFTSETNFKERAKTGLLGVDIGTELKLAKDRRVALVMDVAFKGFDAGKETLSEPSLRDILGGVFGGEDAGEAPPPQDKVVVLASIPSNPPLSTAAGDRGLFSTVAVDALKGAADTDGYGPDGLIVVDEFVRYLETKLPEQTRTLGKTPLEKEAVPFIVGEETAHFPLTKNPKLTATVEKRVAAVAAIGKDEKLAKDVADEAVKLLGRMPKLKAQQELRKKAEQLADGGLTPADYATARADLLESLKLPPADAETFARTVMSAIELVRTDYVKDVKAGEWAAFAVKGLYRRIEEPVPADVQEQLKTPKELTTGTIRTLLEGVRTRLGKREDLDGMKGADTTIQMMFVELRDPYTTYYDEKLLEKSRAALTGEFFGVGIQIRRDLVRDGLLVVSPIKGSPAYKAGIRAGDLITAIKRDVNKRGKPLASDEPPEVTTKGMKTEQALEIILGDKGVPVTLVVERDGKSQDFTIERARVSVETVVGVKRDDKDDWTYFIDPESKIGYVCLTGFGPSTPRDLAVALTKLKRDGMKGLVLDVRFNPGGQLQAAVVICDLFLQDGLIVSVEYRAPREPDTYVDQGRGTETKFPIAVLINGQSASASEIVAACLQDASRAVVVGERSYGKGSVQTVKPFGPTGGQIKVTTARYFPPSHRNIDKASTPGKPEDEWGVKPDSGYEVKLSREEAQDFAEFYRERDVIRPADKKATGKVFKDRQLDKAVEFLKGQAKAADAGKPKAAGG